MLRRSLPVAGFAALCYVPLLLTEPGAVAADTKQYLYLDPGRLLSRAWSMWDPHVGMGTVTHQNIGYLWPMGPYYWVMEQAGLPDWVAQRLWHGSIMFTAGLGMAYLVRTFGWRGPAVAVPVLAYALTPYLLSVMARISALLLPVAALPLLLALAIRALRVGGWRHPAAFALVVTTVGTSNATAIILVGVAPLLWFPYAVWLRREVAGGAAAVALARIGALALATNLWWIAGLSVQATHGIDVLRFTETAEVAAASSAAQEVLRGLGYWFFYGEDRLGPWIEPSVDYTQRIWLLAVTFCIPVLALAGAALARWRHREFVVILLTVGMTLAVGAYPFDDPSPVGRAIRAVLLTEAGLAMRNLARAVPLVVLAIALALGAGTLALLRRWPALTWPATIALAGLAIAAFPPLWQRAMVPENLRRDERIPQYWLEAAAHLDRTGEGTRVLEIPGADFAAYRWGNTVDPITPGLMDRPMVARELVPAGSPPSANLLKAFDLPLQEHISEPESYAPVARLMRAGHVLVRSDLQFERYSTPRPRELWDLVTRASGLGEPARFGPGAPNEPIATTPLDDELALSLDPRVPHPPEVAAFPVTDPVPIVAAKPTRQPVVLAGDGAGIVDMAGAGLLRGDELLLYSAALDGAGLRAALAQDAILVLTDSNRRRGERWATVRFVRGYTEPAGRRALVRDLTDNRLPVFPGAGDDARTVALHRGGLSAVATSYGNPLEFTAEDRAAGAVDGDPSTAWRTGTFGPVIGERLVVTLDEPATVDHITLVQPADVGRWLTRVRLHFDGRRSMEVDLGLASHSEPGQRIAVPAAPFRKLELEVLADTAGDRPRYGGLSAAGVAELRIGDRRLDELIRPPVDLLDRAGRDYLRHPLAIVLTRLRSAPTEVHRDDEERAIERLVELPAPRAFALGGTARLSARAPDAAIEAVLGAGRAVATSSSRLPAMRTRAGAAIDGDPYTAWTAAFGDQLGQWIELNTPQPFTADRIRLGIVADGEHSVPTRLGVQVDGAPVGSIALPELPDQARPLAATEIELPLPAAVTGRSLRLVVEEVRAVQTIDWYSRAPVVMPVAVTELAVPGVEMGQIPEMLPETCRDDLLTVDGAAVGVRLLGRSADALAGRPVAIEACSPTGPGAPPVELPAGEAVLRTAEGRSSGIDLDRLVLRSAAGGGPERRGGPLREAAAGGERDIGVPRLEVLAEEHDRLRIRAQGATPGAPFWLAFGQSHSAGWQATATAGATERDLGPPALVDGFANGWLVEPSAERVELELAFTPQRRVDVALWVSLLAALACVALVARAPRSPGPEPLPDETPAAVSPAGLAYPGAAPSLARGAAVVAAMGLAGVGLAHPLVGAALAAASAAALWHPRGRLVLLAGAPACVLAAAAYVIAWQIRHDIRPGLEWVSELHRAHPVAWAGVLALLADVVVERARSPGRR